MIMINNRPHEWKENMTVKSLLHEMRYTFPEITVKINDVYIPKEKYAEARIKDGDNVLALHMFGGG